MKPSTIKNELQIESGADKLNPIFLSIQFLLRVIFFIFLLLAMFGFFGTGLFGHKKIQQGALTIEFEKYARIQSNNVITIHVNKNPVNKNGLLGLWLDSSIQNHALLKSISPKPVFEGSADNKIIYYLKVDPTMTTFNFVIVTEPFKIGFAKYAAGIINGESIAFKQFVYP